MATTPTSRPPLNTQHHPHPNNIPNNSPRPALPFGLGRDPQCGPSRCQHPSTPLPVPGSKLHDEVSLALSRLFSTFFSTSLRYLGVSEILDWLQMNRTIDAWILTGLEQGRSPHEIGSPENLKVGRGAILSVIKAALEQDDEAWATSLREVGFSSGLSMAYEGLVSQLKPTSNSPLPCLHTLLTPAGLAMLKSAPLKQAFPLCPPRPPPSPASLLQSIRTLIANPSSPLSHTLASVSYRQPIRKAFVAYHALVLSIAEELITAPSFANQYKIFLTSISQPLQLVQLIADDFEEEFGKGSCRGLLGVGDVGGRNLGMIMSFCRSGKPSELLERVRERVRERKKAEDEGRVFSPNPPPSPQPPPSSSATAAARSNQATVGGGGFKLGSSKDLAPSDPFASTAPRAEFKNGRANGKGKGRALPPPTARYSTPPPPLSSLPKSIRTPVAKRTTPSTTITTRHPQPQPCSCGVFHSDEEDEDDDDDDYEDEGFCEDCAIEREKEERLRKFEKDKLTSPSTTTTTTTTTTANIGSGKKVTGGKKITK